MDFNTLLGQIESTRPDLAQPLALIRQFQKEKEDQKQVDSDVDSEKLEKLAALFEKQRSINKNLLHQYHKLEHNCGMLMDQLDEIAEAIGACPRCWGADPDCSYCLGKGKPGYFQPNMDHFARYIKPVLVQLKNNKP